VTENRKLRIQAPPPGFVWIEDYRGEDGSVLIPGIASRLGITPSTYRKWRMRDQGPPTVLIGKKVAARVETIENYLRSLEESAVAEAQEAAEIAARDMRPAESRFSRAA
jgi:phage antirepressor YoqD-like protein